MHNKEEVLRNALETLRNTQQSVGYYDRTISIFEKNAGYEQIIVPTTQREVIHETLEWLAEHKPNAKPRTTWRVLDVGCSIGSATFSLAPLVQEVIGVDVEQESIDVATAWKNYTRRENVSFITRDIANHRNTDLGTFDLILIKEVTEHLGSVAHLQKMLATIHGLLAKDGIAILETPNYYFPIEPHFQMYIPPLAPRMVVRWLARYTKKATKHHETFINALLIVSPHRIARIARRTGFNVTDAGAHYILPRMLDGTRRSRGYHRIQGVLRYIKKHRALRRWSIALCALTHAWPTVTFILEKKPGLADQ